MKRMNFKKGFTLIELLVVVAIIGILASVVLASLNTARTKGTDAAIKANLANTRAQASLYYDTNGGYSIAGTAVTAITATNAGCSAASTVFASGAANSIFDMVKAAQTAYGGTASTAALCSIGVATTTVPSATWAAYVPLKDTTNGAGFCVDSTGTAKQGAALAGAACP